MDRIFLTEDRDKWRTLVNTVVNLGVPKMRGFGLAENLLASEGRLLDVVRAVTLATTIAGYHPP